KKTSRVSPRDVFPSKSNLFEISNLINKSICLIFNYLKLIYPVEESTMIKEFFSKNTIGALGIGIALLLAIMAYQAMTNLFVQAVVSSLQEMHH
ncbi:MAG: hypothetical protein VX579_01365, partial [Nitrospinota bacterium]|nr:hypothetical protein [Nitrospinota bacterium]